MLMPSSCFLLCLIFLPCIALGLQYSAQHWSKIPSNEQDRIRRLPGQPKGVLFHQYSGFISVNVEAQRELFYWLIESPVNASSKPLVLWLNGGPGCSSMGYGGMEEIGPFRIRTNATGLYMNEHSWNDVANLLFLESPAGVGYSYSKKSSDYSTAGDSRTVARPVDSQTIGNNPTLLYSTLYSKKRNHLTLQGAISMCTAADSLLFLVGWFDRFPHYRSRPFYIIGESYAGHYVPQLAMEVHKHNIKISLDGPCHINLQGFMVGNAVTDWKWDNQGIVDYYWSHALISDETYEGLRQSCSWEVLEMSDACQKMVEQAYMEVGNVDLHSVYTPVCLVPDPYQRLNRRNVYPLLLSGQTGFDPCTPNYADAYFNREDVRKAFHATKSGLPSRPWTICNYEILDNWQDKAYTVLPIYRELLAAGLRIWVYSGDEDAMVPVTGTRYWLRSFHFNTSKKWYPWYHNHQVGGWSEVYKEGLTFATVRGAGHEVPVLQPQRSLTLLKCFLAGTTLPHDHTDSPP